MALNVDPYNTKSVTLTDGTVLVISNPALRKIPYNQSIKNSVYLPKKKLKNRYQNFQNFQNIDSGCCNCCTCSNFCTCNYNNAPENYYYETAPLIKYESKPSKGIISHEFFDSRRNYKNVQIRPRPRRPRSEEVEVIPENTVVYYENQGVRKLFNEKKDDKKPSRYCPLHRESIISFPRMQNLKEIKSDIKLKNPEPTFIENYKCTTIQGTSGKHKKKI